MASFENLQVWLESKNLCVAIYKELDSLSDYGFKSQITRSALSIPSNIAEGCDRYSLKEQIRFYRIAKGSTAELRTQVYIGIEIEYILADIGMNCLDKTNLISAQLSGLIKSISQRMEP